MPVLGAPRRNGHSGLESVVRDDGHSRSVEADDLPFYDERRELLFDALEELLILAAWVFFLLAGWILISR